MGGHQADDPADEGRDHRVQDRDQPTEHEQRGGEPGDLPDVEPVEANQPRVGRRSRRAGGGIEQSFETRNMGLAVNPVGGVVNRAEWGGQTCPTAYRQWPRTQTPPTQRGPTQTGRGAT